MTSTFTARTRLNHPKRSKSGQIRRRGWTATTGVPIPLALLGPAVNLDHEHATGLVRGLLCTPCNSSAEPAGIRTREDVWSTYTTQPPIGEYHVSYPPRR